MELPAPRAIIPQSEIRDDAAFEPIRRMSAVQLHRYQTASKTSSYVIVPHTQARIIRPYIKISLIDDLKSTIKLSYLIYRRMKMAETSDRRRETASPVDAVADR